MEDTKIFIQVQIDLQPILDAIAASEELGNDPGVFRALAQIENTKKLFSDAEAEIKEAERRVKEVINGRAKALYGDEWSVIKGDDFKINRVMTGPVFEADDNVDDEFLRLKVDVNSRKVEEYIKANSTLPEGISYNRNRGESLRINIDHNE